MELGTGIHGPKGRKIVPKKGKFLVFEGKDGLVFARSVEGMKPQPFLRPAFNKVRGDMGKILARVKRGIES